jgi:AraC-like DNA-binding protein
MIECRPINRRKYGVWQWPKPVTPALASPMPILSSQPAALHGLGHAWLASDSHLDGLKRLVRYQRVISTTLNIQLEARAESYNLIFHATAFTTPPAPASIDAALASFYRMCQITAGPDIRPLYVKTGHDDYGCSARFEAFFGTRITFGTDEICLCFDKKSLERELATAHPELARVNDQMVIDYLKHFDKTDTTTQVRAHIIEQLPNGLPHQERIAHLLNLSLRNLQRKLQVDGTSFKEIMDETRKDLAIQYLKGSERSIMEISFLLGFSESSNFSRAFRRWTGDSPQHYR